MFSIVPSRLKPASNLPSTNSPADYFCPLFSFISALRWIGGCSCFLSDFDLWPTTPAQTSPGAFCAVLEFSHHKSLSWRQLSAFGCGPSCFAPNTLAPLKSQFVKHKLHPGGQSRRTGGSGAAETLQKCCLLDRLLSQPASQDHLIFTGCLRWGVKYSNKPNKTKANCLDLQKILTKKNWTDDYLLFILHH